MTTLVPLDMTQSIELFWSMFPVEFRQEMQDYARKQHAEGNFRASEDILYDFKTLRFWSYYCQKITDPITEPMKGSKIKEKLAPYRTCRFDLKPREFVTEKEYRLSASGDLMRCKYLVESKDRLYEQVEDLIFGADYAIANFESEIAPGVPEGIAAMQHGGTPHVGLTMPEYETLKQHKGRKFDILQLANNHAMDCGEEGLMLNMDTLESDGIHYIGTYKTEADSRAVKITRLGDLKIAWICHTWSLNGKPLPPGKQWMIDMTLFGVVENPDTSRIEAQITAARGAGCDLVMVVLHWGAEWEFYPLPKQLEWARLFAELGADAIIAQHPHVIQPVEIYRPGSDRTKQVPIVYSLGNMTSVWVVPYTALSLVANLRISTGQLDGRKRTMVTGMEISPVICLAEVDDGGSWHAALWPLAALESMTMEQSTRDYVIEVVKYADLVLGPEWRRHNPNDSHHKWFI